MIDLETIGSLHMIGIGGSGMSAIARLLHQSGMTITGSDRHDSPTLRGLAEEGIEVWVGSDPDRIGVVDGVVASSAIPDTDPELTAAGERRLTTMGRPDLLGAMTRATPTIGVSGTHGKTTGTAMLITAAKAVGLDPSYVVGAPLAGTARNGYKGGDDLLILEADEAFGTFLQLTLTGLVITNIESDHLDHYHTTDALHSAFVTVASDVDGPVVVCVDDPGAARVGKEVGAVAYGTSPHASWRISDVVIDERGSSFGLIHDDVEVMVELPRVGVHDVRNASGVLALLGALDHDVAAAARGLADFGGVHRRFEDRGTARGVRVVDDYAHHPTEVAAVLAAAQAGNPNRVWAVFQPHLYTRTREHLEGFASALSMADEVVLTDIFAAREEPIPGVRGELLGDAVSAVGGSVAYVPRREDLAAHLATRVKPGDIVLVLGAGDINLVSDELLDLLGSD